jgi:hypothetical protein
VIQIAGVGVLIVGAIIYVIKWRVKIYLEKKKRKEDMLSSSTSPLSSSNDKEELIGSQRYEGETMEGSPPPF